MTSTTSTRPASRQTEDLFSTSMVLMEATGRTCPCCKYPSLDYDSEFDAMVCDFCGYWNDLAT